MYQYAYSIRVRRGIGIGYLSKCLPFPVHIRVRPQFSLPGSLTNVQDIRCGASNLVKFSMPSHVRSRTVAISGSIILVNQW
jgi:hypothetical protein